ncbi:MAG: translation initiation factor IF-2 [delta proteobacterium MLS_D]|jgi:translation initiation factor IF-2|nr:MAG: translation initiation factor IF-2 [delta proteobacterium MLS_D]
MPKTRVYELARELAVDTKELIARLEKMGIAVKSHSSTLEEDDAARVRREFSLGEPDKVEEKRVKPTVIRRRSVREAVPEQQEQQPAVEAEKPEEVEEAGEPVAEKKREPVSEPAKKEKVQPEKPAVEESRKTEEKPISVEAAGDKHAEKKPSREAAEAEQEAAEKPVVSRKKPVEPEKRAAAPEEETEKKEKDKASAAEESAAEAAKKRKRPVPVPVEDVSSRKKAFVKQVVERKERRGKRERDTESVVPWRESRKQVVVAPKKTEITTPKAIKRRIKMDEAIRVGDLAKKMGVKTSEVISKLMSLGMMVTINQSIDVDVASLVAGEFGYQVETVGFDYGAVLPKADKTSEKLRPRAPVVTVMGHVDHGKTSLLDAIRQTNVIEGESGGITQAIGAYLVRVNDRDIVFLDTPGHEAFTTMRARGAKVTDIVVLVVAADDGVMDQTIEAINHSRAANVPIIVAVNKIDKAGNDPERIRQQLSQHGLVPESWGGDTIFAEVSAKQKIGLEELLELILLQADMLELKADPDQPAKGVIVESKLDKGRGPVATVLIQEGTLHEGDAFVSKTEYGKVRAMIDDQGRRVAEAGPSMPVEVIGFSNVPSVGVDFVAVEDEKKARGIGEYLSRKEREKKLSATSKITLEQLYERIKEGTKELRVVLKGDVQGSIEALSEALTKLSTDDITLSIIHASVGAINENDVMLASASEAVIIGFLVRPDARVIELAEQEGVDLKYYDVIYEAIAEVRDAMEGLLEPIYEEVREGEAEVREIFRIPKVGVIAGSYVTEGKLARNSLLRVIRDGVVVHNGKFLSLKRFKDDVKEVTAGYECGIGIEGFDDLRVGDVVEAYTKRKVERTLDKQRG